jgi:hypothetical protein
MIKKGVVFMTMEDAVTEFKRRSAKK